MGEHGVVDRVLSMFSATSLGFVWFSLIAIWGGTASYLSRLKKSQAPFSIMELVGEWTVSAFAGIITAFLCFEMGASFYTTAALAGISGHMGGRAIAMLESWAETQWRKFSGGASCENKPE